MKSPLRDRADAVIRIASPAVAAEKLGWKLADVLARREALGLPEFVSEPDGRWTPEEDAVVMSATSLDEAADQLGRTRAAVEYRRQLLRKRGKR